MELSRASIEQIVEELAARSLDFSLIVRTEPQADGGTEAADCRVYGPEAMKAEPSLE